MRYHFNFNNKGRDYQICKFIRELVVFARQDLIQDPPFLNTDLISCRNVLIYFNQDLQQKVFQIFHYSLNDTGYLFLGKSETVGQQNPFFNIVDHRYHLYRRNAMAVASLTPYRSRVLIENKEFAFPNKPKSNQIESIQQQLFKTYVPPTVLVDQNFRCVHFFGEVSHYLTLQEGRIDFNLLSMVSNSLRSQLRMLLNKANKEAETITATVQRNIADDTQTDTLHITIQPAVIDHATEEGFLVSFEYISQQKVDDTANLVAVQDEQRTNELQRELDNTRENLQAVIEELETSNEELQSLNEELQASSEELQSSNEELETTNEELQATNEELATVNQELQTKSSELTEANAHLENIQNSIDLGLVVIDSHLRILRYTQKSIRVFGILPSDIGHSITSIQAHLPIERLEEKIKTVINTGQLHSEQLQRNETAYLMQINPYLSELQKISGAVLTFTDVTELQRIEAELRLRNAAIETAADGVIISDAQSPDQPIIYASPAFCHLTGYSEQDVLGKNCRFLQGPDTDPQVVDQIRDALNSNRSFLGELLNYRKNGSTFWNQLRIKPLLDEKGKVTFFVGVQTDITERKQREAIALRQANYDPLTGLPNRNLLLGRLKRHLQMTDRHGDSCYVLFIDLDGFKEINDTLGHSMGDDLLVQAAGRLQSCVRESDTVARFGGDEFVLILPEIESLDTVVRIANSILTQIRQPFSLTSGQHRLSASIGIAAYPEDAEDADALIQHADTAMYRVKANGRDGMAFFQSRMNQEAVEHSHLKQALFQGLEQQQFELYYQPIFDLQSEKIVGAETLVRWHDPERGLLNADVFIPVAESTGQIIVLGQWILERAIKQLMNWLPALSDDFRLSINLSPRQLHEEELENFLNNLPEELFHHLEFEITETVFLEQHQTVISILNLIKAKHGRVSIDDFGMGYSSLRYLNQFPVDTIKIDREFIAQSDDHRSLAIIEAILTIAQNIDAHVVAEGIETSEQLALLKSKPCQYAQGHYFSEALVATDFEALLH